MQTLRSAVVLVLAVLWLPVTMHCKLEILPGLQFLVCCAHPDQAPHQDNDCDEDGCADVESGLYQSEDCHVEISAPIVPPAVLLSRTIELENLSVSSKANFPDTIELKIPQGWQFAARAASLPRAPSLAS